VSSAVINTRALILKFGDHLFFTLLLNASDHWYESDSIDGIWELGTTQSARSTGAGPTS